MSTVPADPADRGSTILGMIPITARVFWGPMASVMGGLAVATLLTLLFLPALYVAGSGSGRTIRRTPLRPRLPWRLPHEACRARETRVHGAR